MKKSSGSPTRIRERNATIPAQTVSERTAKRPRPWNVYLGVGAVIAILVLLILPCRYRMCSGGRERVNDGYRWIMSGIPPAGIEKKPVNAVKAKRPVRRKGVIPAGKPERKDDGINKDSQKPPEKPKVYDFGTKLELVIPPEKR